MLITTEEIPFIFKSWFTSVYNKNGNKMSQILNQCKVARLYWLQWPCVNLYLPYRLCVLILVSGFLQAEKRNENNWEKQKSECVSQMFYWSSNTLFTLLLFYSLIFCNFLCSSTNSSLPDTMRSSLCQAPRGKESP